MYGDLKGAQSTIIHLLKKGKAVHFAILIAMVGSLLSAKEFYAKIEPYEILNVSSNVSGEVIYSDIAQEGKILGKKPYVIIDDSLDRVELKTIESKIVAMNASMQHNREMVKNYQEIIERKQENYNRIKDLKIKSHVEKDRDYFDLVNSQNSLLSIQKEMESMTVQIGDLQVRRSQLKKTISDKHLFAPHYLLYKLLVKPSVFVNPGTPLAQLADVRKGKLTLFFSAKEAAEVQNKTIYMDGKPTAYRIDKIWKVADGTRISSYKGEILVSAPKRFSTLVKVEFK